LFCFCFFSFNQRTFTFFSLKIPDLFLTPQCLQYATLMFVSWFVGTKHTKSVVRLAREIFIIHTHLSNVVACSIIAVAASFIEVQQKSVNCFTWTEQVIVNCLPEWRHGSLFIVLPGLNWSSELKLICLVLSAKLQTITFASNCPQTDCFGSLTARRIDQDEERDQGRQVGSEAEVACWLNLPKY